MKLLPAQDPLFNELTHSQEFACQRSPLHSELSRQFYSNYWSESEFRDLSFAVELEDAACAVFLTAKFSGNECRELSYYGLPASYLETKTMDSRRRMKAEKVIRKEVGQILEDLRPQRIVHVEQAAGGQVSPVGVVLLEAGCRPEPFFTQIIDLEQPEAALKKQVRKSFRSGISWGNQNLELTLVDQANVEDSHMDAFRKLHVQVSGRETRSKKTWDIQLEMIRSREAFAVFGHLESTLVTAALFQYSPSLCFYGVSASDRSLFEKPISHAVIWTAMLHAQKLGCRGFEMGEQLYAGQVANGASPSEKELNISRFKRGFGGETFARVRIVQ